MNVALVVLDTLRRDAISPYEDDVDHTPNLAAFADDATVYETAVAQAPWSLPSQASLLTGRYPWQHGAGQGQPYLRPDEPLLQERLHEAGYRTAAIHENAWMVPATGTMGGFEHVTTPADVTKYGRRLWRWAHRLPGGPALGRMIALSLSERNHRDHLAGTTDSRWLLGETARFLDAHGDEDFFLFCNPINAHYPYTPPERYRERHDVDVACADLDSRPIEYGGRAALEEREPLRALYDAEVDYLDDVFGRLIGLFEERAIADETLFVVCADHGELLGEDDIVGHHFSVRPELTHVPLMIKRPGVDGSIEESPTELREVYYEILRAAGVPASDDEGVFEECAAGLYESPTIYGERLPTARRDLDVPQFYRVGPDPAEHTCSVDVGRTLLANRHSPKPETFRIDRPFPEAGDTVAELD